MRTFLLTLACLLVAAIVRGEPFEIKEGDRVLFLGDTLLEREGTYGYLETRMVEQFADRKFTVRNLAFSADTPLGWSRASFDAPEKGFERLKEQLALVKPTVVFLGYGMAASLQEMTDRSQDWTLNRDPARYGAEPMTAARFKRELAQLMDAIVEIRNSEFGIRNEGKGDAGSIPHSALRTPHLPVRFVLLSPIRHEDLRATRPGLPDPTEHNKLLEQYTKAIEELAKERGARFVSLQKAPLDTRREEHKGHPKMMSLFALTDNGIHLKPWGYQEIAVQLALSLGWPVREWSTGGPIPATPLHAAIIRKNALFFHRWRPANETYLFGFRKREQGQNAAEIPKFDALIEAAEAEIERLKKAPKGANAVPGSEGIRTARVDAISGQEHAASGRKDNDLGPKDAAQPPKNAELPAKNVEVTAKDVEVTAKDDELTAKNVELTAKNDELTAKNGELTAKDGEVTAKDGELTAKNGELTAKNGELTAKNGELTAKDDELGTPKTAKKAVFQPKTPISASTGQFYTASDAPATGDREAGTLRPKATPPMPDDGFILELLSVPDGIGFRLDGELLATRDEVLARLQKVRAAQPEKRVIVRADERLKYSDVRPVIVALGEIGVKRITFSAVAGAVEGNASAPPAAGQQPPVTNHQSPVTSPDARQTPAETPDLSKIPAQGLKAIWTTPDGVSFSTLPLPEFTLADGLEISLWAENPFLAKPTEMNWDAQGRLWVASSAMYPMIAPGQEASDKILILEDPERTGHATKSTVFADGLLLPTGVAPVMAVRNSEFGIRNENKPAAGAVSDSALRTPHSAFNWACYVGQSTELLYFEDTDGDGKADTRRIVLSGFGTEDTHHIVHTLRWGPDGRLYFNQSVYIHTHMETPWGVVRLNSGGVFAYDPRTERVEVFCKGLWNTWGHAWDQWGQSFLTDGAGFTGLSWAFPGAVFNPSEGSRRQMASISPGSYPKFAGLELIYSPHFPADWQGTAVTCDFRAHKVVQFRILDLGSMKSSEPAPGAQSGALPKSDFLNPKSEPKSEPKSGYTTEQMPVLAQTSDATFRPIDVKLGPDGALYIADWSNPIINHGEVDFRDPRRDHEHGRIWRLSRKGGAAVKWSDLTKLTSKELVQQMQSGSLWAVSQARAIMQKRMLNMIIPTKEGEETEQALGEWERKVSNEDREPKETREKNRRPDETIAILEHFRIWNRNYLIPLHLIRDPIPSARAAAARFMEQIDEISEEIRDSAGPKLQGDQKLIQKLNHDCPDVKRLLAADPSPRVRVEVMRALARMQGFSIQGHIYPFTGDSALENASLILDAAINAPKDDPQYELAAWLSINDLAEVWTEAVLAGKWKIEGREKQLEFALDALDAARSGPVIAALLKERPITRDGAGPWIELIGKGGGKAELQGLFERVVKSDLDQPALVRALNAFADAARLRNLRPEGDLTYAAVLIQCDHADTRAAAARLAGLWKLNEAAPHLEALAKNPDDGLRAAAFEGLRSLGGAPAIAVLERLVRSHVGIISPAAIVVLAQLKPAAAIAEITPVLDTILNEGALIATWRGILESKEATDMLAKNFPANVPKPYIEGALRAARELGRKGDRLVAKLAPLAGESLANVVPADFADLAARAKKDGDPVAGEAMYRRMASACTTCHAIGGAGGKLGPDLTSIGASAPADYIIESILSPAAKVKEGYHAFAFAMKDGTEVIGIPTRETPQVQLIRTIAGEQVLPKANIVSKKVAEGGASLMPAGLTAAWTDRERLNLYAFLMELGRPGPFDASKNNVARSWQLSDHIAMKESLELKQNPSAPSGSGGVVEIPVYTLVDGRLTKDLLAEKLAVLQTKNPTVHLTARFQVATAGKAKLNLTGIRKAWLDGQPLAIASEPSPTVDLIVGTYIFTVEVDAKSPPEVLRLESPAVSFLGD